MRVSKTLKEKSRNLRTGATDTERLLWYELKNRRFAKFKFRRQHVIEPYIVDFICLNRKLIIELDGSQHFDQIEYDQVRTLFLQNKGYNVLRFWNNDVLNEKEAVLEVILKALTQPSPTSGRGL
jgi:very-short-patch-repair endonuclease